MRPLLLVALVAWCFCSAALAVQNQLTAPTGGPYFQPAPALHSSSVFPPHTGFLFWGNSFLMEVAPLTNDSVNIATGLAAVTDVGNTTVYTITFVSTPQGAFIFEPPSIQIPIYTSPGSSGSLAAGGIMSGGGNWWFSPNPINVTVTAVSQEVLSTLNFDPYQWWEFNFTDTNPLRPLADIEINATLSCVSKGASCGTEAVDLVDGRTYVTVDERPLAVFVWDDGATESVTYTDPFGTETGRELAITAPVHSALSADSDSIVVMLPLTDPKTTASFTQVGSPSLPSVAYFQPGRNNQGGSLTISLHSCAGSVSNQSGTFFFENPSVSPQMVPANVVISAQAPAASFKFTAIPWVLPEYSDYIVSDWFCRFRVVESVTGFNAQLSLTDTPSNTSWPQGAYNMPIVHLMTRPVEIRFNNFAPYDAGALNISPRKLGSYRYQAVIDRSPADLLLGQDGTISLPFVVSPSTAMHILVATTPADSSFVPVDALTFTGYQRVIEFTVDTQDFPSGPDGVNLTFLDIVTAPLVYSPDLFSLSTGELVQFNIIPNLMEVTVTNNRGQDRIEDGITPNQPFWMLFEWTPPTSTGFIISVDAFGVQYPDGTTNGSATFTVGPNQSAYLAGPFIALEPTNLLSKAQDVEIIPFNIALSNISGAVADSEWFTLNTPILVTVRRDRIYLVSTPIARTDTFPDDTLLAGFTGGDLTVYELSAAGFVSEPFCVGVSLNSHFFANGQQEIWVTPWSETLTSAADSDFQFVNRSGLIFSAVNNPSPSPGVSRAGMPSGTVVLSRANNGTGCFSVSFDRNWQFLSTPLNMGAAATDTYVSTDTAALSAEFANRIGYWRVQASIGGPDVGLVFEDRGDSSFQDPSSTILRVPHLFSVRRPTIQWQLLQEMARDSDAYVFAVGEEGDVYVTLSEAAQHGLNYAVTCTGCVLTQESIELVNGQPGFPPGSIGPHRWHLSFEIVPVPFSTAKRALSYSNFSTSLHFWSYGPDAAYFVQPPAIAMTVLPRSVEIDETDVTVTLGLPAGPFVVLLSDPAITSLTVVPIAEGNAPLIFNPSQLEFTAIDGLLRRQFTVSLDPSRAAFQLGAWRWSYRLEGPDAYFFTVQRTFSSATWVRRDAPVINPIPVTQMVLGATYGPLEVLLTQPLLPEEGDLILTPRAHGANFTPSTVRFTPLQLQHTFSVRVDPLAEQPINSEAVVFWSMSGSEAWKYEVPSASVLVQHAALLLREATVAAVTEPSGVRVGVTYSGAITLLLPTPSSVQFRLSGTAMTFNPTSVNFTASSGLTQFFAFTVARDLPMHGAKTLDALAIIVNTAGADRAYYPPTQLLPLTVYSHTFFWASDPQGGVFFMNRPSRLFTLSASAAPTTTVTLTFSSPYLAFSPASLTYGPGILTRSFSFTPILLPATPVQSSFTSLVEVKITGRDAELYRTDLEGTKFDITILPEIDVSPLPALYADGESEDIWISLKNHLSVAAGLPNGVNNYNAFTISIIPLLNHLPFYAVEVTPSVLEFSSASTTALRSFRLRHVSPALLQTSYRLNFMLKYAGETGPGLSINTALPAHAQEVIVLRYHVIPLFPKVLSYGWENASFNLTRACTAPLTLTPHAPRADGSATESGHLTPIGRVHFDPPVISFAPGQLVANFRVKAARGVEDGTGYYRVDWVFDGHLDDLQTFDDWYWETLSTYHTAGVSAAPLCISITAAMVALLVFM